MARNPKVTTDGKWKEFRSAWDVPKRTLRRQFDWMDDPDDYTFLKYHRHWYSLSDFMRIGPGAPPALDGWDGAHADGFTSGVLIKISSDGEQYQIGYYS